MPGLTPGTLDFASVHEALGVWAHHIKSYGSLNSPLLSLQTWSFWALCFSYVGEVVSLVLEDPLPNTTRL